MSFNEEPRYAEGHGSRHKLRLRKQKQKQKQVQTAPSVPGQGRRRGFGRLLYLLLLGLSTAFLLSLMLPVNTSAQNGPPTVPGPPSEGNGEAQDNASNYTVWNHTTSEVLNGGFGFGPWVFEVSENAGAFLAGPASPIMGLPNPSFGLFANPRSGDNTISVDRVITVPLQIGGTFSFDWATFWDAGNGNMVGTKGFNLIVDGIVVINIEHRGQTAMIRINDNPMFTNFGGNAIRFHFERLNFDVLRVYATGRDGNERFDQEFTISGANGAAIDAFRFYAARLDDGSDLENRQPYFNNFLIQYPFAIPPTENVTSLFFSNVTQTSFRVNWLRNEGNGGMRRIVVIREGSPVTFIPQNGTSYADDVNTAFINTNFIDDHHQIVYAGGSGDDDFVTITGLSADTEYHIAVFEYNINEEDGDPVPGTEGYLTNPARGQQFTLDDAVILSAQSGFWNESTTWVGGNVPITGSDVVIFDEHQVQVNVDTNALRSLTISNTARLFFLPEETFILTMQGGSSLNLVPSGTFDAGGGLVNFLGSDTADNPHIVSGAFVFNDLRIQGGAEPTGLNFGSDAQLTGTFEIAAGGFVSTNPPSYQPGSTLFYNTGGTYNRGSEWPAVGDNNSPFNVRIGSELDMSGHTTPRAAQGDLEILSGGSLTLSTATGGDLQVGGDWTNAGTFTSNFRAVFFNGSGNQVVTNTQSGGIQIDFLRNQNRPIEKELVFRNNLSVIGFRNEGRLRFEALNGTGDETFTLTVLQDTRETGAVAARITNEFAPETDADIDLSNVTLVFVANGPPFFFNAAEDSRLLLGGIDFQNANSFVKEGPGELVLTGEANTSLFIDAGVLRLEDGFSFDDAEARTLDIGTAVAEDDKHEADAELVIADLTVEANTISVKRLNDDSGDRTLRFVSEDGEEPATLESQLTLEKLLFVRVQPGHYGALNGPVTGTSPFVKQETGSLTLETESFAPGLFIDEGRVRLNSPFPAGYTGTIALGTDVESDRVASEAVLEIGALNTAAPFAIAPNLQIRGNQGAFTAGLRGIVFDSGTQVATLSSPVVLNTDLDVTVAEGASGVIQGIISGTNGLNKRGAGQLDLAGNNTFTGTVQLFGGTTRLGGSGLPGNNPIQIRGDVGLASNGTGTGGARTIANGVEFFNAGIRLGEDVENTGALTFTGNFELGAAERFINTIRGTHTISGNIVNGQIRKEGTGQLNLSGVNTVDATSINAGTLRLNRTTGETFTLGGTITINDGGILDYPQSTGANNQLRNDAIVVVNGTDISNRGHFDVASRTERISTLTLNGGLYTKAGGTLTIDDAANFNSGFVNFSAGSGNTIVGQSLSFGNIAAEYTGEGANNQTILTLANGFTGSIIQLENTQSTFLNNRTSDTAIPTIDLGGHSVDFEVRNNSRATLAFAFANGALTKAGPGTLVLNEASTFAGGLTVSEGTVAFTNNAALGAASGTVTLNGGILRADADGLSFANPITLISTDGSIEVSNDGSPFTLTHSAGMSGNGDLTKTGPGTLTLGGAATFTGATNVQAGILNVNGDFVSTDLNIGNGSQLNFGGSGSPRVLELTGFSLGQDAFLRLNRADDELIVPASVPVTIPGSSVVETNGDGARLTLQSGARYVNLSASTPTLRVERMFSGDTNNSDRQGWRMLASPVNATYADMFEIGADPATFVTQGFTGATFPGRQFNLLWWDETDATGTTLQRWRTLSQTTDQTGTIIPAGRGHFFYIFDGAPLLNPGSLEPSHYTDNLPLTMSATGTEPDLSDDPFNFGITFTAVSDSIVVADTLFVGALVQDQGWNLIGNPTASWLNWNAAGWTRTNVNNVIYVWDPASNEYLVTNGETGTHDGFIAPFQAFWVQATDPAPNLNPVLSFTNAAKTVAPDINSGFVGRPLMSAVGPVGFDAHGVDPNQTQASAGRDAGGGATVLPLRLRVAGSGSGSGGARERVTDKFVMLSERGQFGADRWDAYRLEPMSDSWLTLASAMAPGSAPMVINSLPRASEIGGPLNLPLYVGGASAGVPLIGDFTLEWELPADWDPDLSLVLMDHVLQQAIPMRGGQTRYTFTHATDPGMLGLMVSPAPGDGSGFGGPVQIGEPAPGPASASASARGGRAVSASASVYGAEAGFSGDVVSMDGLTGRKAATGLTSVSVSASDARRAGPGLASVSASAAPAVPMLPASLLGGRRLPADWSPDFESATAALPEALKTAPVRADDAHIPYIPLDRSAAGTGAGSGSGTGTGTALGRSLPAGTGGPEARFSLFMQPLSGGPDADETIPYTPIGISLAQNYPNPFNPSTTVRFSLPEEAQIRLEVFDLLGRRVTLLTNDTWPAGTHTLRWDATGHATGLYLLRLTAPETDVVETRKMMLVR
ncbi:autotransporter-associated beta strand repeat-containing protein [Cyclonatronum proteinivorum]|nr:autotransporter-associated beta strand repeat-containing protein [Cyclonatronum proteinivorum]